jgi:DNA-directed RNA polymerase specialized sigma24 family protein
MMHSPQRKGQKQYPKRCPWQDFWTPVVGAVGEEAMADDVPSWLDQLKNGDPDGAQRLWEAYFEKLMRLAHRKLSGLPRRAFDEEDVALSAMNSFVAGARAHRFPRLDDETDLWKLLVTITSRKATARRRGHFAASRNYGAVKGESDFAGGDDSQAEGIGAAEGNEPTPAFAAEVADECRVLFAKLEDPLLRSIASWKMEGYTNDEIAQKLGRTERTVERKLSLIREYWSDSGD